MAAWSRWLTADDATGAPPAELDDAALLAAARADPQAFALLYTRYVGAIYGYCYLRLRHREAAEDATGEVFAKALAAFHRLRGQAVAAWLFRIAHNVVIDSQRRRRATAPLADAAELPAPDRTPDEAALTRVEHEALWAALDGLPDDQRAAVVLQLLGWPDARSARALGRSPAAVRMLRLRALERLRAALAATHC